MGTCAWLCKNAQMSLMMDAVMDAVICWWASLHSMFGLSFLRPFPPSPRNLSPFGPEPLWNLCPHPSRSPRHADRKGRLRSTVAVILIAADAACHEPSPLGWGRAKWIVLLLVIVIVARGGTIEFET